MQSPYDTAKARPTAKAMVSDYAQVEVEVRIEALCPTLDGQTSHTAKVGFSYA